jgi:hypothetical protein
MLRFRTMKTMQKFSAIHASVQTHFNQERHLVSRQQYKQDRSAALVGRVSQNDGNGWSDRFAVSFVCGVHERT